MVYYNGKVPTIFGNLTYKQVVKRWLFSMLLMPIGFGGAYFVPNSMEDFYQLLGGSLVILGCAGFFGTMFFWVLWRIFHDPKSRCIDPAQYE